MIHVAAAASLLVALAGVAGASRARTVTDEYHNLELTPSPEGRISGRFSNTARFMPRQGERAVSIVLSDAQTDNISATVSQDLDGDGSRDSYVEICDRTERPFRIDPSVEVLVSVQEGFCNGAPSFATTGEVKATFTR